MNSILANGGRVSTDTAHNTVRVLHITIRWGVGKGGVKSFIGTILEGCPDEISQSVLSIGAITGEPPITGIQGPIVDSKSPVAIMLSGRKLTAYLKEHPVDVVHIHTNNALSFMFADCARRAGVPMRIVHSHNSMLDSNGFAKVTINKVMSRLYRNSCTDRWACSNEAGEHLFGGEPFVKVNNAVNADRFAFSSDVRGRVRRELGIEDDEMVLVHVGAGIPAKNTERALRILRKLLDKGNAVRLILLGEGSQTEELKALAEELGLAGKALFVGFQDAPEDFYCASDAMLAPSLFEGLPICVVEAQANALPVVLSDDVSRETSLTELVEQLSLSLDDDAWADAVVNACARRMPSTERQDSYVGQLREKGFTEDALCAFVTGEYLRALR